MVVNDVHEQRDEHSVVRSRTDQGSVLGKQFVVRRDVTGDGTGRHR